MNFNKWVEDNWIQLSHNYNKRYNYIYKSSCQEFCNYIYTGMKNKCVLPREYTRGIKGVL